MKSILAVTAYLKNFLRLGIFTLMLAMGGFTALALSPVSVEDYNAYKQARDRSVVRSYAVTNSRVAGISDEQLEVKFENLLEGKGLVYSYRSTQTSVELSFEVGLPGEVELLRFKQAGPIQRLPTYTVELIPTAGELLQDDGDYALLASEMPYMRRLETGIYEVRLGREGTQELRLSTQQAGKFTLRVERMEEEPALSNPNVQPAIGNLERLP